MKYRTLGKTGTRVSALGFGAMRLPTTGEVHEIDERASIDMLRYAIDQGVNYVDTAYVYHEGNSEIVVGKALQDGYRSQVYVATKSPVWMVKQTEDFDRFLNEQLARLQTDHIDFYLLHCLQQGSWQSMRQLGAVSWAERAQRDGRIGQFGFSFHDSFAVFQEIVDAYDWGFCQIQYNLVNEHVQAGTAGLKYAAEKGLGVVIMEPLFGGTLANPPESVREIWHECGCRPADVALRWLWDKPEVSLVLSGMSAMAQVEENIDSARRAGIGLLTEEERVLIRRVRERYEQLSPIPCTKCGYCLPCPHGVNIPVNFELFNEATVFQGSSVLLCRNLYHSLPESQRAAACEACGTCEELCPQDIDVSRLMAEVKKQFN
jgi:predicted aldo/keto reductase-like oxidoreductase